MNSQLRLLAVLLLMGTTVAALAQGAGSSAANPKDLFFTLSGPDGRTRFHLGELVRLQTGFATSQLGKYLLAGPGRKIAGFEQTRVSCQPAANVVDREKSDGRITAWSFLHEGCGSGRGGGIGGACTDCDELQPLGLNPIHGEVTLNQVAQFTRAGSYTCTATDGEVTEASMAPEYRALSLHSNPLALEIVDDAAWSSATLKALLEKFGAKRCNVPGESYDCMMIAHEIHFLDTPESLAESVHLQDGREHLPGWQNELWMGLFQSRHQDEVIRLLKRRFSDADYPVSRDNLEVLTALELRQNSPEAFEAGVKPETYRSQSVSLLQDLLRTLGDNLPDKLPSAYKVSRKTFYDLATADYCQSAPIIPDEEREQLLKKADVAASGRQN